MIEELQLLIPLLKSAGEGVFWLVIAVLGVQILKGAMYVLIVWIIFFFIFKSIKVSLYSTQVEREMDNSIFRRLEEAGFVDPSWKMTCGKYEELVDLLKGAKK